MRVLLVLSVLLVAGCGSSIKLLTGESRQDCFPGPGPVIHGTLEPNSVSGVAIRVESSESGYGYGLPEPGEVVQLMFPAGYTASQSLFGAVEIRDRDGRVIASSGKRVGFGGSVTGRSAGGPWPVCSPS